MEMKKQQQPKVAKKLWKLLQIVIYMTKIRSIGKSKAILDLQTLLKRTKSVLNYSALTCRSNDGNMFVSPREYEFSCSNTPAHHNRKSRSSSHYYYRQQQDEEQVNAVQKMLEMLNRREAVEVSPLNLPGFGRSPYAVRQLRVTDSPFAAEAGSGGGVDKDCEEFIDKFYKSLNKERRIAALDQSSPSPYHLWAR